MGMPMVPADTIINRFLQRLTGAVIRGFDRYMPEPFAFGIVMTLAAMVLTYSATPADSHDVVLA